MKCKIFRLSFLSPVHFSRGRLSSYESSYTFLHSDKLKAALYATAVQLFGNTSFADVLLKNLRLSSAFPYDHQGYWLPKPFSFQPKTDNPRERKHLKAIKYLKLSQLESLRNGLPPQDLLATDQPDIWEREVTQRVKITRDEDSEPYYLEKLYAKGNAGLYFIACEENEVDWQNFFYTLTLLGEDGIGLQKGLGNGQFTVTEDSITFEQVDEPTAWLSLSLYRPETHEELNSVLESSYYQIIKRGGWISTPEKEQYLSYRKKSVMFFTEGSVFAFQNKMAKNAFMGKFDNNLQPADIGLNHPIWRDGRAIFLPIKT